MRKPFEFDTGTFAKVVAIRYASIALLLMAPGTGHTQEITASGPAAAPIVEYAILRASDGSPVIVPFVRAGDDALAGGILPIGKAAPLQTTTRSVLSKLGMGPRALLELRDFRLNTVLDGLRQHPDLLVSLPPVVCFGVKQCWPESHIYYEITDDLAKTVNAGGKKMQEVIDGALGEVSSVSNQAWTFCSLSTDQLKKINKPRLVFQLTKEPKCFNSVGYQGTSPNGDAHSISIYPKCGPSKLSGLAIGYTDRYSVVHEILHALGFRHAHQNPVGQSGQILTVHSEVLKGAKSDFDPVRNAPWKDYDFCSVMHYPWNANLRDDLFLAFKPGSTTPITKDVFRWGTNEAGIEIGLEQCADEWNKSSQTPHKMSPPYNDYEKVANQEVGQHWFLSENDKNLLTTLATLSNSTGKCYDKADFKAKK